MNIQGTESLSVILHAMAQSFLLPVVAGLFLMVVLIFIEAGSFIAEKQRRKDRMAGELVNLLQRIEENSTWQKQNLLQVLDRSALSKRQKYLLQAFAERDGLSQREKDILARDLLDQEEFRFQKSLDKTDLITRLGPVLGLMGTLIPLGPGLAQLGQGDVKGLSEAVVIAFDTTVVGVAVGAVASLLSKVRRRWYQKDLSQMELLLDLLGGGEANAAEEEEQRGLSVRPGK